MDYFTLKDFIKYNSPCIACGRNDLSVIVGVFPHGSNAMTINEAMPRWIRPIINGSLSLKLILSVKYNPKDNLEMVLAAKTNNYYSNNYNQLHNYLSNNDLVINLECDYCNTTIKSNHLSFDFNKKFIKPLTLNEELIYFNDDDNNYSMKSSFSDQKTNLHIMKISNSFTSLVQLYNNYNSNNNLELPLLPISKFQNKKQLLEKIKMYLTFS